MLLNCIGSRPLTGDSLNDCGRSSAWAEPQGRSTIEKIGLTPPFSLHPIILGYFAGEKQPAYTQTIPQVRTSEARFGLTMTTQPLVRNLVFKNVTAALLCVAM